MKINVSGTITVEKFLSQLAEEFDELGIEELHNPALFTSFIHNNEVRDLYDKNGEQMAISYTSFSDFQMKIFKEILLGKSNKEISEQYNVSAQKVASWKTKMMKTEERLVLGQVCEPNLNYLKEIGYLTEEEYTFLPCLMPWVDHHHLILLGEEDFTAENFSNVVNVPVENIQRTVDSLMKKFILAKLNQTYAVNPHIFNVGANKSNSLAIIFQPLLTKKVNKKKIEFPIPYKCR